MSLMTTLCISAILKSRMTIKTAVYGQCEQKRKRKRGKKMVSIKKPKLWIVIGLIICLLSSIGSNMLLTDGGQVDINELYLPLPSGESIHVYEYRPVGVSVDNPAPAVLFSHGNDSTLQNVQTYGMELSRRGFVAFLLDITAAGKSSPVLSNSTVGYGLYDLTEYVYGLDYIDNTRIGIGGFSKGGKNVYDVLVKWGTEQAENPDTYVSRAKAAYILDCMELPYDVFPTGINVAFAVGQNSPYNNNWSKYEGYFTGDFSVKGGAKKFLNSSGLELFAENEIDDPTVTLEVGKIYGDIEAGTGRVIYNPAGVTHILSGYSNAMVSTCSQFFMETLGAPNPIPAEKCNSGLQVFVNSLSIVALLFMIAPVTLVLLDSKLFASFSKKENQIPAPILEAKGAKGLLFFLPVVVLNFVMALTAIKFGQLVNKFLFLGEKGGVTTWFVNSWQNSIATILMINGALALLVMTVFYFMFYKKQGATLAGLGISIHLVNALKAILLGFVVFAFFYLLSGAAQYTLMVDFRLCDLALPWMTWDRLLTCLRYTPFIVIYWCISSISTNAMNRYSGMSDRKNLIINIIANIIGIVVVCLIHYYLLMTTSTGLNNHMRYKYFYLLQLFVPLTISGIFTNRVVFNKTGNVFVGPVSFGIIASILTTSVLMLPDWVY